MRSPQSPRPSGSVSSSAQYAAYGSTGTGQGLQYFAQFNAQTGSASPALGSPRITSGAPTSPRHNQGVQSSPRHNSAAPTSPRHISAAAQSTRTTPGAPHSPRPAPGRMHTPARKVASSPPSKELNTFKIKFH